MAERRKVKKRKEDLFDSKTPSKEEHKVAKYLLKHVPCKKTKFLYHTVKYFIASKAIDALLESPWATDKSQCLFTSRDSVVDYLDMMLKHKFFHRAKKITVHARDLKSKSKKKKKEGDSKKDETSQDEKKEEEKKRKIKLDMHLDQVFVDGSDAYVWMYDPVPLHYWFIGGLVVVGIIAVCLFPLWPPSVRKGVYYLSLAASGFLAFIIGLAVLRLVLFCLLWCFTLGRHHLWIFPNLTEDVGFFASFWPLYKYEYKGPGGSKKKKKKSDDEDDEERKDSEPSDQEKAGSASESESSQNTQTGKDFEMVSKDDVDS